MRIMFIERKKIPMLGDQDIWPLLMRQPTFRNLKPKLGQGGTVRITISHRPTK